MYLFFHIIEGKGLCDDLNNIVNSNIRWCREALNKRGWRKLEYYRYDKIQNKLRNNRIKNLFFNYEFTIDSYDGMEIKQVEVSIHCRYDLGNEDVPRNVYYPREVYFRGCAKKREVIGQRRFVFWCSSNFGKSLTRVPLCKDSVLVYWDIVNAGKEHKHSYFVFEKFSVDEYLGCSSRYVMDDLICHQSVKDVIMGKIPSQQDIEIIK